MESRCSKQVRSLKLEQTLFVDFETTSLIDYKKGTIPWIIEFGVAWRKYQRFSTMITPPTLDFEIAYEATAIHGWTKEKLIALPKEQRPTLS